MHAAIRGMGATVLLATWLASAGLASDSAPTISLFPGGSAAETVTAPAAYAASSGVYYLGGFGIRQVIYNRQGRKDVVNDTALTGGFGLGKPGRGVMISGTVADVTDLADVYASVKWQLWPETVKAPAAAVGVEDVLDNVRERQAVRTPYAVVSRTFWNRQRMLTGEPLFARTTLSVGYGGGRFGHQPFVALASSLTDRSQGIVEHDRYGINVGLSAAPWRRNPGLVVGIYGMRVDNPAYRTVATSVTYAWWR